MRVDPKVTDLIFAHLEEGFDRPCICFLAARDPDGMKLTLSSMSDQEAWLLKSEVMHECSTRGPTKIIELGQRVRGSRALEGVLTDTGRLVLRHQITSFVIACSLRGVGNPIYWASYESGKGELMEILKFMQTA